MVSLGLKRLAQLIPNAVPSVHTHLSACPAPRPRGTKISAASRKRELAMMLTDASPCETTDGVNAATVEDPLPYSTCDTGTQCILKPLGRSHAVQVNLKPKMVSMGTQTFTPLTSPDPTDGEDDLSVISDASWYKEELEEETTTMDDPADQLLHKIRSWLEEKENCEKNLWKLVKELENLRKNCNAGECVGNTISVVGSACLLGGAAATFFTAGAAAPFLGMLGMAYIGFATSASGGPIRLLFDSFAQFCQNFTEGNSGSGNGVQSNKPKSEEQAAKSEKVRDMDSSELEGTLHVGASGMSKEEEMAIELMNQQTNQATNNDQGNQSNQNQPVTCDEDDVKRRKSESATTVSSVSENDTTASSLGIESEEYSTSFATSDKESSDGEGYLPGALLNVSPSTFKFHHEAGQDEPVRGVEGTVYGGVAIQYKDENKEKEQERICFSPTFKPVFDIVAMVLENDKLEVPVVLVNLYISPKKIKAHFGEFVRHFEELLCILKKKGYDHVIITVLRLRSQSSRLSHCLPLEQRETA
ncbi:unnamed protein product [Gadus morhua 'NCC']